MFSITCAQKVAKIKTAKTELKDWERRRRDQSAKIQEKRRDERSSKVVFPQGYGPAGRVPKYVVAHIDLLKESPLARPVLSLGRGIQPSECRRRPQSVIGHHATKPKRAHDRRFPIEQWKQQKTSAPEDPSPLLFNRSPALGASAFGRSTLEAGGRVRPTTAPCESSQRRRRDFLAGRKKSEEVKEEEARLLEKMAQLSSVRRGGEFPTVAALKTAVALKSLRAQLRGCRARNSSATLTTPGVRGRGDSSASQKRAASAPASINPAAAGATPAAARVRSTSVRRRRCGREQREPKPWDNRSPFVADDVSPSKSTRAPGSPTGPAAPVLRTLTRHDPAFGCVKASSSAAAPPPPPPPHPESPMIILEGGQHNNHNGERGEAASSPSAAPVAQEQEETRIQACFRRLTVGALVELGHLRNPPKPVVAVLAGLGCLLGWKQDGRGPSSRQDRGHPPRSLFSNVYVLRDVLASVCPERIPSRRLSAVVTRLGAPEAAPERVRSANAAAWVLLEWLLCVVACARSGSDGA